MKKQCGEREGREEDARKKVREESKREREKAR